MVLEATTVRLPKGVLNELDAEAEELGLQRSAYIRLILSQRHALPATTTASSAQHPPSRGVDPGGEAAATADTGPNTDDTEANTSGGEPDTSGIGPNTSDTGPNTFHAAGGETPPDAGGGSGSGDGDGGRDGWAAVVAEVDVPGSGTPIGGDRRAAVVGALELLDDEGPTAAGDIYEPVFDRYETGYESPRSMWKNMLQPAFNDLRDRGVVELRRPRKGVWGMIESQDGDT